MIVDEALIPDHAEPATGTSWRVEEAQPIGTFLTAGVNDKLLQVSMELAAELWSTRRRLAAVEAQLVNNGAINSPDNLPPVLEPEERTARDHFVGRVFGSLLV